MQNCSAAAGGVLLRGTSSRQLPLAQHSSAPAFRLKNKVRIMHGGERHFTLILAWARINNFVVFFADINSLDFLPTSKHVYGGWKFSLAVFLCKESFGGL